jgi:hypothetical protein
MTGRAISRRTSGGTGAGPGVNKYFFNVGTMMLGQGRFA